MSHSHSFTSFTIEKPIRKRSVCIVFLIATGSQMRTVKRQVPLNVTEESS